jgi:hypothetical protein
MRQLTDDLTPPERKALTDIDEAGLHIVHVPGDDGPGYSFTIGLWHSFDQPEVIVFGLPEEVAHELLNALADEAAEDRKFLDGQRHDGLLIGYPVRFVDVPRGDHALFLGLAQWAYAGEDFPCVQLVWPDKQGRWPWEAGVRQGFADSQPVLGRKTP